MPASPKKATIRSYQVGFGDCFLLSFEYDSGKEKHILIDFGSTGLPNGVSSNRMMEIARDIEARTGGRLDAVVATHRHKDHISGFATKAKGKGTGNIIASLGPKLVIQPWTEDPKLKPDATGPKKAKSKGNRKRIAALANMQAAAGQVLAETRSARYIPRSLRAELSFLGDDNLANLSAVQNLIKMAPNNYVFHGKSAGLARILPGIRVDVLGPPTVDQSDTIKEQRAKDPEEFWHMRALAADPGENKFDDAALFPKHVGSRGPRFPVDARWLIHHARLIRGDQLLQIVRMLDDAMNNTSVILLFTVGKKSLLFPGDAQLENWKFALAQKGIAQQLAKVHLYKVGHHGSLNATPKSMWKLLTKRSKQDPKPLIALMSTLEHKHGSEDRNTEVPRRTLLSELTSDTSFFSTQMLTDNNFFHDTVIEF